MYDAPETHLSSPIVPPETPRSGPSTRAQAGEPRLALKLIGCNLGSRFLGFVLSSARDNQHSPELGNPYSPQGFH